MNTIIPLYWIMTDTGSAWVDLIITWDGKRYYRSYHRGRATRYFAVMDDFGNLVEVKRK